jgi:uncharacterized linocin/CFP29 family protein
MDNMNIDFIGQGRAEGAVASRFASEGRLDPGAMRPFVAEDGRTYTTLYKGGDPKSPASYQNVPIQTNGTLRRDEWKQLDAAILDISRNRLGGIDDLRSNGLVFNLGNAMGTTVLEYHDISDAMEANLSMDGVTRGLGDRPVYQTNYLPLPIIHVDFEINMRVLEVSRRNGNPLDTTSLERATRRVLEKLESMLFTNTTYTFGSGTIYSYLNQTYRNQVSLAKHWDASGTSGAEILEDVRTMKQASMDAMHYGPWMLYVPSAYETILDTDYKDNYPKTIRARIMEIAGIKGIKVVDTLTADNVLLVQMTSDVVRLVNGLPIQVIEWQTEGKFVTKYKVIAIQVPQVRADQAGNSGVVHLAA